MHHLPSSSLLQSRPARIELARQRFFDEGQSPTGVVGEAVFESWSRCLRLHGDPRAQATFEPVTASRTQLALLKNRHLRQAWTEELPRLESLLATTSCAAMLTDATGVLIDSACVGRSHEQLMPVATRLGVNLSEDVVGTTAPGVAARTGKAVCVLGGEHFFDSVKDMYCAAAPIRDIHGNVAGVLDLSSERIPFEFDAAAVAGLYASAIENRLLVAQSTEHLVIRFQVVPELLDSPMVGLLGVDTDGHQAWGNGVAQRLLCAVSRTGRHAERTPEGSLNFALALLAALPAVGAAPLTLPNGLRVWARAEMRARDGHRGFVSGSRQAVEQHVAETAFELHDASAEKSIDATGCGSEATCDSAEISSAVPALAPTPRLRESDLELIQKTLLACGGNVSDTAARLGVSRGLVYRRLRAAGLLDRATAS